MILARLDPGPVRKEKAEDIAELIDRLAARFEPAIAAAFRDACKGLSDRAQIKALADAIAAGNTAAVYAALGLGPAASAAASSPFAPLTPIMTQLAAATGEAAAASLAASLGPGAATLHWDMLNPATVDHLRTYAFDLVTRLTNELREGVRETLTYHISRGHGPAVTARALRETTGLGLTKQQARALANYRAELERRDRGALERVLRDHRFDKTVQAAIKGAKTLTPEQIDKMVARYAARLLAHRAMMIARTESIRAANVGAWEAMRQAAEAGHIPEAAIVRRWIVAKDERTCPTCKSVPRMNPKGVGLRQPFATPWGPALLPPLHPLCRCTITHRIRPEAIEAA